MEMRGRVVSAIIACTRIVTRELSEIFRLGEPELSVIVELAINLSRHVRNGVRYRVDAVNSSSAKSLKFVHAAIVPSPIGWTNEICDEAWAFLKSSAELLSL